MRSLFASGLFSVVAGLSAFEHGNADLSQVISDGEREKIEAVFGSYLDDLKSLGLIGSFATLNRFVEKAGQQGCTWGDLIPLCAEFRGRWLDETKHRPFFTLAPIEVDFYEKPRQGWERSIERFPAIVDDVEESRKCFALSRYPASVFHSLQIVETGLIELGQFLKVNDPLSGWSSVAAALQRVIDKKHQNRTAFEKKNFAFLEQTQGTVAGLKNAWRNKISHSHGKLLLMTKEFSPEVAEEILMATRAFIRRLADGLPPSKKGPSEV